MGVAPTEDTLVEVLNELSAEGWQVDGVLPKVTVDGVQHSTLLLVSFPPEMIEAAGLLAARGHTWR